MNDLALYFSAALLCILAVFSMMGIIITGQANTLAKYSVNVLVTVVGTIMFGIVAELIVNIIKVS